MSVFVFAVVVFVFALICFGRCGFIVGSWLLIQMVYRYWWVLLGVAVLAMAGGGDK